MKLIFLDTEGTGVDTANDRLCQVCYKVDGVVRTEYFKPSVPISIKAMSITHITNKMVEDMPPFAGSQMRGDLQALLDEGILVAHNSRFDVAMLENDGMTVPRHICTYKVAQALDLDCKIPEYNLQYLRYFLGLEIEGSAHDAEGDVLVLEGIFARLFAKMVEQEGSEDSAIARMLEITNTPMTYRQFNFGKHIGKKIADVAKEDPGYLEWLLKQKLENPDGEEDWIHTLKLHLGKL
jgi:exodeoxyribonuclease X